MLTNLAMHYGWWLLALLLIGAEILAPGFFMLWIGVAAAVMGVVLLVLPDLSFPMQVVVFVVLSLASCFLYWKFIRHARDARTDQPLLNRRAEQYVGRRYVLDSAIVNGHGKARVGDSLWLVEGPELPAGSPIEVVSVDGTTLKVRAAL
ncbi:MAG TPA: NfeD family protein [Rudaea sp.]|nr:NfeD family protein [Rudaea sp.]